MAERIWSEDVLKLVGLQAYWLAIQHSSEHGVNASETNCVIIHWPLSFSRYPSNIFITRKILWKTTAYVSNHDTVLSPGRGKLPEESKTAKRSSHPNLGHTDWTSTYLEVV